jgi:hypothetical protein
MNYIEEKLSRRFAEGVGVGIRRDDRLLTHRDRLVGVSQAPQSISRVAQATALRVGAQKKRKSPIALFIPQSQNRFLVLSGCGRREAAFRDYAECEKQADMAGIIRMRKHARNTSNAGAIKLSLSRK